MATAPRSSRRNWFSQIVFWPSYFHDPTTATRTRLPRLLPGGVAAGGVSDGGVDAVVGHCHERRWGGLLELLVAGGNATLLSGDPAWLDLHRSQLQMLWAQRREEEGQILLPGRHGDCGWFDFQPISPQHFISNHHIHQYYLSQRADDLAWLDQVYAQRQGFEKLQPNWPAFKGGPCPSNAWFAYIEGRNPDYPEQILRETRDGIYQALDKIENDDADPEDVICNYYHSLIPVVPEGLIQMMLGTPAAIYNGGLLHTRGGGGAGGSGFRRRCRGDAGQHRPDGAAQHPGSVRHVWRARVYLGAAGRGGASGYRGPLVSHRVGAGRPDAAAAWLAALCPSAGVRPPGIRLVRRAGWPWRFFRLTGYSHPGIVVPQVWIDVRPGKVFALQVLGFQLDVSQGAECFGYIGIAA